jgi:hypothetical protein
VFINLETDAHILHSSPRHTCVNLPPPIAFRLPLTSALGRYSDSRSDSTRNSTLAVLSIRLHPPLRSTHLPHCNPILTYTNPTRSSVSICATSSRTSVSQKSEPTPSDPIWTSILVRIILVSTSPNPCHPIPLFKPAPSDPVWASVFVHITIQTLAIQLRSDVHSGVHSDIRVSLCLTSSSPCLWGTLRPPSLSALQVPHRSEPLVTLVAHMLGTGTGVGEAIQRVVIPWIGCWGVWRAPM